MAKVTFHDKPEKAAGETPSQAIVRAANEVSSVADAQGRTICIKRLTPVERLRMLKLIGGTNEHYMGMASLAFMVCQIDGELLVKPTNELALEGLISRLGDDGLAAVAEKAAEIFGLSEAMGDRAAIKNS